MKKFLVTFLFCLVFPVSVLSQTYTAVTATVTDSDGQLWSNAKYTATLYNPSGTQQPVYTNTGVKVQTIYTGAFNSVGTITSVNIPDNNAISPAGTRWIFKLCSNTSAPCSTLSNVLITGSTQSLTTFFNVGISVPRFVDTSNAFGYSTNEVLAPKNAGVIFYNTQIGATTKCNQWSGLTWISCDNSGVVIQATPGQTISTIISLHPECAAIGCTIYLPIGVYRSGYEGSANLSLPNIHIEGEHQPWFNSSTSPTALIGGSIIQGTFNVGTGANGFNIRNVGIDVGPTFVNANYGGTPADALAIYNPGSVVGAAPIENPVVENVSCLAYSISASVHCMLVENVDHANIHNTAGVFGAHGSVLKGTNSTWDGDYQRGHSLDSFIVKSDDYAPTYNNLIENINVQKLVSAGDTQGIILQSFSAAMYDMRVSNISLGETTNYGILLDATHGFQSTNIQVTGLQANGGSANSAYCLWIEGINIGVTVAGSNCTNWGAGVYQFDTQSNNINITGSTFQNMPNGIIESANTGIFNSVGNSFYNISLNAMQNGTGSVMTVAANSFTSVTTAYGGSGIYQLGLSSTTLNDGSTLPHLDAINTFSVGPQSATSWNATDAGIGYEIAGVPSWNDSSFASNRNVAVGGALPNPAGFGYQWQRNDSTTPSLSSYCLEVFAPDGSLVTNTALCIDGAGNTNTNGGSANHAICWKPDGRTLGYCSAVVAVDGTCGTCN